MKGSSKKAFQELLQKKIITKRAFEVMTVLDAYGPSLTAGEIFMVNQTRGLGHNIVKGSICARLSELEAQGVVTVVGQKKCPLTGKTASIWKLTGKLPATRSKVPKIESFKVTRAMLWKAFAETLDHMVTPKGSPDLFLLFTDFMKGIEILTGKDHRA